MFQRYGLRPIFVVALCLGLLSSSCTAEALSRPFVEFLSIKSDSQPLESVRGSGKTVADFVGRLYVTIEDSTADACAAQLTFKDKPMIRFVEEEMTYAPGVRTYASLATAHLGNRAPEVIALSSSCGAFAPVALQVK